MMRVYKNILKHIESLDIAKTFLKMHNYIVELNPADIPNDQGF